MHLRHDLMRIQVDYVHQLLFVLNSCDKYNKAQWRKCLLGFMQNIYAWLTIADELRTASIDYDKNQIAKIKEILVTSSHSI